MVAAGSGCRSSSTATDSPPILDYVGSSTIANYIRDAEAAFGRVRFRIDTEPESVGGEQAIVAGQADLAGVAGKPRPETLAGGIRARAIAKDAIAVIVHADNPLADLTRSQLHDIFTGVLTNWSQVGGPARPIHPYIVGPESATRRVFRSAILGEADYAGCQVVRPDQAIPDRVAADPGGIGQISFSFLGQATGVKTISVDSQPAQPANLAYPITRPLYLLWHGGHPQVEAFVDWALSDEGQRLAMQRFVGIRVVGQVRPDATSPDTGTLVVYTETQPVYDGGIYYYPHRPYQVFSRDGKKLRDVPNHRGANDEKPTKLRLPPGTYLVRPETPAGAPPELLVSIEAGKTTRVDVAEMLRDRETP